MPAGEAVTTHLLVLVLRFRRIRAHMDIKTSPLSVEFGTCIQPQQVGEELSSVFSNSVHRLFEESGLILLRNFSVSNLSFESFTLQFGDRFLEHGNPNRQRISGDGFTISVTPGGNRIDLHSELAYSPFRPHIVWFYCAEPAGTGGETVLCDGCDLFKRMNAMLQQKFLFNKVTYIYRDMSRWRQFLLTQSNDLPLAAGHPGSKCTFDSQDKLKEFSFTTSVLPSWKGTNKVAFACSLLDWGFSFEEATFEDGSEISAEWISYLRDLAWSTSTRIKLQANDILMIDNDRFMHGREEYYGSKRRMFLRMAC
jgi:alpha-ketoglutarate-dependent taurine dioxygenase